MNTTTDTTTRTRNWCDCSHWTTERTDIYGNYGRCQKCYETCPASGGCQVREKV